MSLMYYSRMRFIVRLIPLLLKSVLPARVVSVFAAGTEDKLILDDLPLQTPSNYGYFQARSHIVFMTTVFMEWLADKYKGKLSLTHVFPGLVITPAFGDPTIPLWFRAIWLLSSPFTRFVAVPPEAIGNRILFLATSRYPARGTIEDIDAANTADVAVGTDGNIGSGAYSIGQKSEVIPTSKAYNKINKVELATTAYNHTMRVFEEIETRGKFEG